MEKSRLAFDLHTHTVYSHGKGSIEDNWEAARLAGLDSVGIADHGPGHIGFGLKLSKIDEMKEKAAAINKKAEEAAAKGERLPKVLIGVEANIINPDGSLDIGIKDQEKLDFVIAGYHFGTVGKAPTRAIGVHMSGFIYSHTGFSSSRQRRYNTRLVISALYNNRIKLLSHPGAKADFDIDAIARACAETGTWMEINNRHGCLSVEGIKQAAKYPVSFVINSDAHRPEDVGKFAAALARAQEAGLDLSRIVNLRQES